MTTDTSAMNDELRKFNKLADLMDKVPGGVKQSEFAHIIDDLRTNTSKEAQDVRDIMYRMVGAEVKAIREARNQG